MTVSPTLRLEVDSWAVLVEERVQQAIAQATRCAPPIIRCSFQQGRLCLLAEEPLAAPNRAAQGRRMAALALVLQQVLASTPLPEGYLSSQGTLPVRFYLRQRGKVRPYAARDWRWQPAESLPGTALEAADATAPEGLPQPAMAEAADDGPGSLACIAAADSTTTEGPLTATATFPDLGAAEAAQAIPNRGRPWRSIAGLVLIGFTLGGMAYGLSRPCWIGPCDRRQAARDLSQPALSQLQENATAADIQAAAAQTEKAIRLLSPVPPWSAHYKDVQAELRQYRAHLDHLNQVEAARGYGNQAAEKSQDPPHPVAYWVEVHLLWQKAMAELQQIPEESPLMPLVQNKLAEYAANHKAIGQRLQAEERAEATLSQAMKAAQLATARTQKAATLSEWLIAQRGWQQAIDALGNIPQGTLAYEEAQNLLQKYRRQLSQTRIRVNAEKAGDRAYQASRDSAAEAERAASANQWSVAAERWRRAYIQGRQVPQDTVHYAAIQARLGVYQSAILQAENQPQRVAVAISPGDLQAVCPAPDLCTISQQGQGIEVALKAPYDSALRQAIAPPPVQNPVAQATPVAGQTRQLIQTIMQLGARSQLPITILGPGGEQVAEYRPEYGGFSTD